MQCTTWGIQLIFCSNCKWSITFKNCIKKQLTLIVPTGTISRLPVPSTCEVSWTDTPSDGGTVLPISASLRTLSCRFMLHLPLSQVGERTAKPPGPGIISRNRVVSLLSSQVEAIPLLMGSFIPSPSDRKEVDAEQEALCFLKSRQEREPGCFNLFHRLEKPHLKPATKVTGGWPVSRGQGESRSDRSRDKVGASWRSGSQSGYGPS